MAATQRARVWASGTIGRQDVERANVEPAPAVEHAVRQLEVIQPPNACAWCMRLRLPCRHVPGARVEWRAVPYVDHMVNHRRRSHEGR